MNDSRHPWYCTIDFLNEMFLIFRNAHAVPATDCGVSKRVLYSLMTGSCGARMCVISRDHKYKYTVFLEWYVDRICATLCSQAFNIGSHVSRTSALFMCEWAFNCYILFGRTAERHIGSGESKRLWLRALSEKHTDNQECSRSQYVFPHSEAVYRLRKKLKFAK